MVRLYVICEGLSEVAFVEQVLRPHLEAQSNKELLLCKPPNLKGHKSYAKTRKEIKNLLSTLSSVRVTTMIDLFKLPGDFPGRSELAGASPTEKVLFLETKLADDIEDERFIPYFQLHEFEALILSDLTPLMEFHTKQREDLIELASRLEREFKDPEHVNDLRPPSYRLKEVLENYEKRTDGVLALKKIGIQQLSEKCEHFGKWVKKLETITLGEKVAK